MRADAWRRWIVIGTGILTALLVVQVANRNRRRRLPPAEKRDEQLRALSDSFAWVAEQAGPAVVNIYAEHRIPGRTFTPFDFFFGQPPSGRGRRFREPDHVYTSLGSGVVVDGDGHVLTNHHVIEGAETVRMRMADGRTFRAEFIGSDPDTDVAVLRVAGRRIPHAQLGRSDLVRVGDWVVAIGNPFGLAHTVTSGIISAKGRSDVGVAYYEDFLQTDAAINPGNSGGPLLDLEGRVIGINTAIASQTGGSQGIGFAIPIDMAYEVMETLLENGAVERGYLGVSIQDLTPDLARNLGVETEHGAVVSQALPGSPANAAGIEAGDVVTRFNGHRIDDANDLRTAVGRTPPGDVATITIARADGVEEELSVTVGSPDGEWVAGDTGGGEPWAAYGLALEETGAGPRPGGGAVTVVSVQAGSPADEAGLREGDLLLEVQRVGVRGLDDVRAGFEAAGDGAVLLRVGSGDVRRFVVLRAS